MASPEQRCVFSLCADESVTAGLREVSGLLGHPEPPLPSAAASSEDVGSKKTISVGEVSDRMFCSACQCPFESREEQMEHYKLDWHRFNLRKRLEGRSAVTVEEFEKKTGAGDISSISGSDSDSEDEDLRDEVGPEETDRALDTDQSACRLSTKVVFQNTQGQYLSLYRCVLQSKKDNEEDLVSSLLKMSNNTIWVILMTGGGHFAGAVFKGKEIVQHKTFHRYTVRAKRGTAQGLRDSQNRSHMPKSAGAALRRYNEAALHKDIHDLLESWAEYLKEASAIFLRAPSYNKSIFFGGREAPLDKKDQRVRVLPFATRRATFREIQRVFDLLSTIHVCEKDTEISNIFSPSKKVWKKKTPKPVSHSVPNTSDSSNREITEEKADDELLEEGEQEGEDDSKEMQRKSKGRRKPKGKKRQPEEVVNVFFRDKKGQTPYVVAPEKDTRNTFRKYMAEHPHKYDYTKAQRALAAERRLAEHMAKTGVALTTIRRCFQCGESLLGKIPFEYLDYSFCTPRCVQAHRKANAAARP
ncbi:ankyrin repeat and zinc finger domain-containing 1-like isoform X1 [Labeo rohita]|uniref:Ankyrin repeat and zinc finger domain-containing 1-like isoform X1 n=1 Tax=Labeo rohita TaxID=84645 RepID=A0A498N1G8_LABRO|nr:ankyrin repeat and zinc finger domain-containing 1-like isoform X1 [Labeo rohita]